MATVKPTFDQSIAYTPGETLQILADVGPAGYMGPETARNVTLRLIRDKAYAAMLNAAEWRRNTIWAINWYLGIDFRAFLPPTQLGNEWLPGGEYFEKYPFGFGYDENGVDLTDEALIALVKDILAVAKS